MERHWSDTSALWFVGGIALGGAAALLIASDAGKATRLQIVKQAKRGGKGLSESGREIFDKGRDLYERGRELAEEAADMFERGRAIAEKKVNDSV